MVYNAMKMFMEINPQLFDECSHEYNERQNSADQREKARKSRWDQVELQAKDRKNGVLPPAVSVSASTPASAAVRAPAEEPSQVDEIDSITQDSQKRLNALKLQDESGATPERRVREAGQNSVSDTGL